jgi:RNA polymerase sigma-70 factor (ECF subfamily)
MTTVQAPDPVMLDPLVRRAADGDDAARVELFARNRDRLRAVIRLRLDDRLRGRLDEGDVLQEVYLAFARRLAEFAADPAVPFFVWLRTLACQKLTDLHRHHLGAKARDVRREVSIDRGSPAASSAGLAALLMGRLTTASEAAARDETRRRVQEALDQLAPADREVLVLRYFEQMTNEEVAATLGLSRTAASNRYTRALARFAQTVGAEK